MIITLKIKADFKNKKTQARGLAYLISLTKIWSKIIADDNGKVVFSTIKYAERDANTKSA